MSGMETKIRYIVRHKATGNIEKKIYTLCQIEERPLKSLSPAFSDDYELLSRDWYTGLKDSNGNEIYEKDIIKISYETLWSEHPYYFGCVEWLAHEDYPAFDLRPWLDVEMNSLSWLMSGADPSVKFYEVVGNICENPGLLNIGYCDKEELK